MNKHGKEKRELITFFVLKENLKSPRDWAREMKIAGKLWEKYPEIQFWKEFNLTYKLRSLAWLIGEEGDRQVRQQWEMFKLDKSRQKGITYELVAAVPVAPKQTEFKPKTLKDFLK